MFSEKRNEFYVDSSSQMKLGPDIKQFKGWGHNNSPLLKKVMAVRSAEKVLITLQRVKPSWVNSTSAFSTN